MACAPGASQHERHIAFYNLLAYLYHVDRLHQNRPIPLLTTVESEQVYLEQTTKVYDCLPFDGYQVSLLIQLGREDDGLAPTNLFIDKIPGDPKLTALYEIFVKWLESCRCPPKTAPLGDCSVHKVIDASLAIAIILDTEVKEAYSLWYGKNRRKSARLLW